MAVWLTIPGRGRLEVRWVRAVSNPRRATVPIAEQVRQNLVREVGEGRMEPEEAERRFERFLTRHEGRLREGALSAAVTPGPPEKARLVRLT